MPIEADFGKTRGTNISLSATKYGFWTTCPLYSRYVPCVIPLLGFGADVMATFSDRGPMSDSAPKSDVAMDLLMSAKCQIRRSSALEAGP
jgi:hypothetical protein